ncbi:hypothetical protein [Solilutibacter silvestris]|uniref:Uncharacterized protein n=1 Tax=Solilutibacter silvestris TaxID=1645665 RepID=A0A2K1Q004_9GAMM|nr:hypothetical protein [Lysobacter silvestris]PNS08369.1 hypothetical protein Lysil_2545 [Lysobacter silvestris]
MNILGRCDAAYRQLVLLKCYDALEAVGFTRYRKEWVDWPLGSGFHCWVGLNNALEEDRIEINLFVGIHVAPIMKLYTALEGRKYSRGIATYAVHMGTLAPYEPAFEFTRKTDVEAEAARLALLYSTVGLSYAQSIASYEHLLPLLKDRVPMLGAYPERFASCLYLMDLKDEARSFVEEFLKDHRDYFEGFAVPFLKMMSH